MKSLAYALADALNRAVPAAALTIASGFHLAGLRSDDAAEFWYIRNVGDDGISLLGRYEVREDFQRRDAPAIVAGGTHTYRNGDISSHVAWWEKMDALFGEFRSSPGFTQGDGIAGYARWVRFKLWIIAEYYKQFSNRSIIGPPVDTFLITTTGVHPIKGKNRPLPERGRRRR